MKSYTGKTLEDLLSQASADTGVSVDQLMYNVTEEKDGILNIGKSVTADVFTMDDVKEFLFDYLGNYFTGIDLEIEVAIEEKEDGFVINLNADNNAVLIGKMGKTLQAFNTIVKAAVNAQFKKRLNVMIDVNHYKEERYEKLTSMAKRIGKQVQASHITAELDPMPNDERKVIHQCLNSWHNLKTESAGDGAKRHVCVSYVEEEDDADKDIAA
jgi:spoIIIJ-associated protein